MLEEYEKRKVILKAQFSSSINSWIKKRAWQEIANIVNAGNSVKRYIKEIHKKWDNICAPQKLRFLYIVGAKDKQVIDNVYMYIEQNYNSRIAQNGTIVFRH